MEILKIVSLGIVATITIVVIKGIRPEFTVLISILTGIFIFSMILNELYYVIENLYSLARKTSIDISYFSLLIKILGMAYIVEFGSQISRDSGQDGIAMKIELGGKVLIMVMAMPILLNLIDLIIKILP